MRIEIPFLKKIEMSLLDNNFQIDSFHPMLLELENESSLKSIEDSWEISQDVRIKVCESD